MASTLIRTDLVQPVFTQSETDSRASRQADSAAFRWWEVAGTSHVDSYLLAGITFSDAGTSPESARQLFGTMLRPFTRPISVGDCALGVNAGPHHWIFQAANPTPEPLGCRRNASADRRSNHHCGRHADGRARARWERKRPRGYSVTAPRRPRCDPPWDRQQPRWRGWNQLLCSIRNHGGW